MMVLRLVSALYMVSGLWCMLKPSLASSYVGYAMESGAATAEFFTVYGGIQLGLGLAMLLGALKESYAEATLFFAMVFSVTLFAARLVSFMLYPAALDLTGAWLMAELEAAIAFMLIFSYFRVSQKHHALDRSLI